MMESRAEPFEPFDPEVNDQELEERSARIEAVLDNAFHAGEDAYSTGADGRSAARRCSPHSRARAAFLEGWLAAADDDEDSLLSVHYADLLPPGATLS